MGKGFLVGSDQFLQFRVKLIEDAETGQVVAEAPTLGIADYGVDGPEALNNLQEMIVFHLECLQAEGQPIPQEDTDEEGIYLRVRLPVGAS